jgi:hypothetical protein
MNWNTKRYDMRWTWLAVWNGVDLTCLHTLTKLMRAHSSYNTKSHNVKEQWVAWWTWMNESEMTEMKQQSKVNSGDIHPNAVWTVRLRGNRRVAEMGFEFFFKTTGEPPVASGARPVRLLDGPSISLDRRLTKLSVMRHFPIKKPAWIIMQTNCLNEAVMTRKKEKRYPAHPSNHILSATVSRIIAWMTEKKNTE